MEEKKRILTGDRPTGLLHLGHYVGSLKNRVQMQKNYDCYFIIADLHTLTTKPQKADILKLREHTKQMVIDYLACGIDPSQSTIFLQSAIPAVYELNLIFEMFVSLNRLTGLPSIKEMARNANIDPESIPFGLVGYPVLQSADILLPKADLVPVGKDNECHVELARDIARRFNQHYGDIFPQPAALLSDNPTLVGIDGKGKMSKSANNAIYLCDSPEVVEKKVKSMFTDPDRLRADMPGEVEGNPVFIYHDNFNDNRAEVETLKARYRAGTVGDVEVKQLLSQAINRFLAPIRAKRAEIEQNPTIVEKIIYEGTLKMQKIAENTMKEVRSAMGMGGAWKKIVKTATENR